MHSYPCTWGGGEEFASAQVDHTSSSASFNQGSPSQRTRVHASASASRVSSGVVDVWSHRPHSSPQQVRSSACTPPWNSYGEVLLSEQQYTQPFTKYPISHHNCPYRITPVVRPFSRGATRLTSEDSLSDPQYTNMGLPASWTHILSCGRTLTGVTAEHREATDVPSTETEVFGS